jgi:hypothetical protein
MQKAIVARAQQIITNPKAAWAEIDAEPADISDIYKSYVVPLAAIPAVAGFIGMSFFGIGVLGTHVRIPIVSGIGQMVVTYLLTLAAVYVFALIIDWLAPQFGAEKNFGQAFKVAAYSATASWLAGIFNIFPALSILTIIGGLYSLYLLFIGLPALMKPSENKATIYTLASIGCAIVLSIIVGAVVSAIFATRGMIGG